MPVHLNSIVNSEKIENVFSNIISKDFAKIEAVFVTEDKLKCNGIKNIIDKNINEAIGRITYTIKTNEKEGCNELIDSDITLLNDNLVELNFEDKYKESSDANEYYQVSSVGGIHFEVETVGRYRISNDIEGTKQKVYLSAFPFQMNLYNTVDELNKDMGFEKPIQTPIKNLSAHGYSTTFMGCGSMITKNNEPSSLIIGVIESYRDITTLFGNVEVSFTIINLKTGVGIIPVAVSKDIFNLTNIDNNRIVMMLCNLKAEFI